MIHILVGDSGTPAKLPEAARHGGSLPWTVPKKSTAGDTVILFVASRFLGLGKLVTPKIRASFKKRPGYEANVGELRLFSHPVELESVASVFPDWGWPRYPRSYVTVPSEIEDSLLETLERLANQETLAGRLRDQPSMPLEAVEGAYVEVRSLTRRRNRALRNAALTRANGVCAACGVDYTSVLDGLGQQVLQVHHLTQFSTLEMPRVNTVNDLAVLCANCHAIVHADPDRAMPVEELKERLVCEAASG